METDMKRQLTETQGRWLLALAASLLLLAAALPASAQASRTRPPEQPSTSSSSGSSSSGASSSSSSGRTVVRSSGDRAVTTRPPGSSGGGVSAVDNDTRSRRYRGHRPIFRGGGHHRYYDPWYWYPYRYSWWLGYYGYGSYGYGYGPYAGPYGYGHYPPVYPARASRANGALDLDLKPGDTQIYLNGQLIGTADDFDGWPEYLWLEEGDYHFIFYKQGHESIVREYKVLPGVVIDVEDRLERGESPPPEELFPPPTERRDARLQDEAERRRRVETGAPADWRQRRERSRVEDRVEGDMDQGRQAADFGSLTLTVVPSDASIYLDGRLIGTGDDLARLRRGLTVDAGDHVLEIVRPGHQPVEREFSMQPGEVLSMAVELEAK
jgi:hypothetical protein